MDYICISRNQNRAIKTHKTNDNPNERVMVINTISGYFVRRVLVNTDENDLTYNNQPSICNHYLKSFDFNSNRLFRYISTIFL